MKKIVLIILISFSSISILKASIVRGIISNAETSIRRAMGDIGPMGNYLVNRTASELNLLVQNAYIMFRNDLDKDISRLNSAKQLFLNKIIEFTKQITTGKSDLVSLIDNVVLDLNAIVGNSIVASDKFIFKRVSHLNILENFENSYYFNLTASNIGFNDNKITVDIKSIELNDRPVTDYKRIPISNNEATFKISKKDLNNHFKKDKVSMVKVTFDLAYKRKKKDLPFPEISFYIALYPENAGNIKIDYTLPTKAWVEIAPALSFFTSGNYPCKDDCDDHKSLVPVTPMEIAVTSTRTNPPSTNDKKIISTSIECMEGHCGYTEQVLKTQFSDDSTRIYTAVKNWASSVVWKLTANIVQYKITGEKKESLIFNDQAYNSTIKIKLPDDLISGEILYKFSSGEEEKILLGTETNRLKLLTILEPKGFHYKEFIYQIIRPDIN